MNKKSILVALAALTFSRALLAADASEPQGDAVRGRALFSANHCYLCHGTEAQGGGAFGPRLGPNVFPWIVVKTYIRAPAGDMPPFSQKVLSDKDLLDIWTFINTVPTPPPVSSIALLNH